MYVAYVCVYLSIYLYPCLYLSFYLSLALSISIYLSNVRDLVRHVNQFWNLLYFQKHDGWFLWPLAAYIHRRKFQSIYGRGRWEKHRFNLLPFQVGASFVRSSYLTPTLGRWSKSCNSFYYSLFASWSSDRDASAISTICLVTSIDHGPVQVIEGISNRRLISVIGCLGFVTSHTIDTVNNFTTGCFSLILWTICTGTWSTPLQFSKNVQILGEVLWSTRMIK